MNLKIGCLKRFFFKSLDYVDVLVLIFKILYEKNSISTKQIEFKSNSVEIFDVLQVILNQGFDANSFPLK